MWIEILLSAAAGWFLGFAYRRWRTRPEPTVEYSVVLSSGTEQSEPVTGKFVWHGGTLTNVGPIAFKPVSAATRYDPFHVISPTEPPHLGHMRETGDGSVIGYYDFDGNPTDLNGYMECQKLRPFKVNGYDPARVASTHFGDMWVSTVWLGLNHQWEPTLPPLIYETMVFGGDHDEYQERWSTKEQALAGHERVVQMVRGRGNR